MPVSVPPEQQDAVLAWLLACYRPDFANQILYLRGPARTGKSVLLKGLRDLLDPSGANIGGPPRKVDDIAIAANNSLLQAADNVSKLSQEHMDAYCRMSTGDGKRMRRLFTPMEEVFFCFRRPLMLAGIRDFITRGDLLDRCIPVQLRPLGRGQERKEDLLDRQIEEARPRLLGAICTGLAHPPIACSADDGRMLDAIDFAARCFAGSGRSPERLLATLRAMRGEASADPLQAWPAWPFHQQLVQRKVEFTATQSLAELNRLAESSTASLHSGWPRTECALGSEIKELTSALLAAGIAVGHRKSGSKRFIVLEPVANGPAAETEYSSQGPSNVGAAEPVAEEVRPAETAATTTAA